MNSEADLRYRVVVNQEDQYAIWPVRKLIPAGWHTTSQQGSKAECLAYVSVLWADMRPASLQRAAEARPQRFRAAL